MREEERGRKRDRGMVIEMRTTKKNKSKEQRKRNRHSGNEDDYHRKNKQSELQRHTPII